MYIISDSMGIIFCGVFLRSFVGFFLLLLLFYLIFILLFYCFILTLTNVLLNV